MYTAKTDRMYGIFTFTEPGGHVTNEDAFAIESHTDDSSCCVCAVADGRAVALVVVTLPRLRVASRSKRRYRIRPNNWLDRI